MEKLNLSIEGSRAAIIILLLLFWLLLVITIKRKADINKKNSEKLYMLIIDLTGVGAFLCFIMTTLLFGEYFIEIMVEILTFLKPGA